MPIRDRVTLASLIPVALILLLPTTARSLPYAATELIDRWIADAADRESSRNQSDQTSNANNSNVVVDSTSVPDLVGLGFSLAGMNQQSGENEQSNSVSASMTAASLIRTLSGASPTSDDYIEDRGGLLRSLAFTAGYDRPADGDLPEARRFGLKFRMYADASTPGWIDGWKFLPARILAAPSTAILRPKEFYGEDLERVKPARLGYDDQSEIQRIQELLSAYEGMPGEREATRARAWAKKLCGVALEDQASPSDAQALSAGVESNDRAGVAKISQVFALGDAPKNRSRDRTRIENAYHRSEEYVRLLVCDPDRGLVSLAAQRSVPSGDAIDALIDCWTSPSCTAASEDLKGKLVLEQDREALVSEMIDAARAATINEDSPPGVPRRPYAFSAASDGKGSPTRAEAVRARRLLEQLIERNVVDNVPTGLTTFGEAVALYSLGEINRAMEKLRAYVDSFATSGSLSERDRIQISALEKAAGELVHEVNKRTEIAVQFDSKLREGGDDDFLGQLNFRFSPMNDCGNLGWVALLRVGSCEYWRYLDISVNAGFDYVKKDQVNDAVGGIIATAIEIPIQFGSILPGRRYEPTISNTTPRFELSGRAKWMADAKDELIGQAKLDFPVADGVSIPLSVSVANRRELINETEVRGMLGFTVDSSRLMSLLRLGGAQGLAPGKERKSIARSE